jgi:O-antigen ligase
MMKRIVENVLFFFLLVFFLAAPSSVAYSEIALAAVVLLWLGRLALRRGEPRASMPGRAILVAAVACWAIASLLSVLFAREPAASAWKLLKLLPIGLVFFLPEILRTPARLRHAAGALLVGGFVTSAYGIVYYLNDPSTRLGGFIGFYMTTAGVLLQIALVGTAVLFTRGVGGRLAWIARLALPVLLAALVLTDTRGAWIGLFAGLFVLLLFAGRKVAVASVALAILLFAVPGKPRETALSAFDLRHPRNRERLFMWKAGLAIFGDHAWTGIGLAGMERVYENYRDPRSEERPPHLHSVPIHLLASMGILGFAAWLFLVGSILAWMVRALPATKRGPPIARSLLLGALAVWIGFLANGLFEWNLGDIEVVTLLWSIVGLGAASAGAARASVARGEKEGADRPHGIGPSVRGV